MQQARQKFSRFLFLQFSFLLTKLACKLNSHSISGFTKHQEFISYCSCQSVWFRTSSGRIGPITWWYCGLRCRPGVPKTHQENKCQAKAKQAKWTRSCSVSVGGSYKRQIQNLGIKQLHLVIMKTMFWKVNPMTLVVVCQRKHML